MAGLAGKVPSGVPKFLAPTPGPAGQSQDVASIDGPVPGPRFVRAAFYMAFAVLPPPIPSPVTVSAQPAVAQPGPVYTKTRLYQAFATLPPQVPVAAPVTVSAQTDTSQPGPVFNQRAIAQAFATLPPQDPATFVAPPIGWLQPFAIPRQLLRQYDLNQAWVPSPPAPNLSWLQPLATPSPAARRSDLNSGWVPQVPSAVAPTPSTLGWLQPFAFRTALRPFYDLNNTWVPQASLPAPTPSQLGWLQPFPTRTAPRPVYDLNAGWLPQPPSVIAPTPTDLGWLQPLASRTAPRPFYDLNSGWTPQVPSAAAPTPSTLGWLQPLAFRTAARPFYDLNNGWVPLVPPTVVAPVQSSAETDTGQPGPRFVGTRLYQVAASLPPQPPSAVVTPAPAIGWLTQQQAPPRESVVIDTVVAPFTLSAQVTPPPVQSSAETDTGQPGPRYSRTVIYQSTVTPPQNVGGTAPVISSSAETDTGQPGPRFQRTVLYQASTTFSQPVGGTALQFAMVSQDIVVLYPEWRPDAQNQSWIPQVPSAVIPPPVQSSAETDASQPGPRFQRVALYQANATYPPQIPAAPAVAPPFGWFQPFATPRQPVQLRDINSGWVTPVPVAITPAELGWLQPFGIPRQPVRLWDWNTAWPPKEPPPVAITPSILGWLQPFGIPPQPPRRPIFIEFYVPQNVGGTAPPPPTVLQPGGASVPHTFSRKRWKELQALIAAEMAAVAKAERLTKPAKQEALLKVARAAAAAVDAAEAEGENPKLDRELLRNAAAIRAAIRSSQNETRLLEKALAAIEQSHAIVGRVDEDEENEMISLLLLFS